MSYPVPHRVAVPTLHDGSTIEVKGTANPNANRITFSLIKAHTHAEGTPFVFDLRFNTNETIRNHHEGSWGAEEKSGGFPARRNERLDFKIIVNNDRYQVYINDQHFCDFRHRVSKDAVRNLFIEGDITIHKINLPDGGGHHGGGHGGSDHNSPPVPFTAPISNFRDGHKVIIAGVPTGTSRFTIYFLCGPSTDHDIALCVDVRFNFGNQHNIVVRNYKEGKTWGAEQTGGGGFPFKVGTPFEFVFKVKSDSVKILVDDEKVATFNYHIRPERVTHISVQGDVKLNHVKI